MKKKIITGMLIAAFTISSSMAALANPWKSNHEQDAKKAKQIINQTLRLKCSTTSGAIGFTTPGAVGITTPPAIYVKNHKLPSVIRIGKLQIPTNAVVKGFKATLVWDKSTNTIIISKNDVTIKFVGDSKVFVNNVEVNIASIKNGKGRLVPMEFIKQTLKGKNVTTPGAVSITTPGAVSVTTSSDIYVKNHRVKVINHGQEVKKARQLIKQTLKAKHVKVLKRKKH